MEMRVKHIIPYDFLFSNPPCEDRLSLLNDYLKEDLIILLSGALNYSGFSGIYHIISFEDQLKLLYQLCGSTHQELCKDIFLKCKSFEKSLDKGHEPSLFSRLQFLFALNECLSLNESNGSKLNTKEFDPSNLLKYLFCINSFLIKDEESYSQTDTFDISFFRFARQHEYSTPLYPILDYYRSIELISHLSFYSEFSESLKIYFKGLAERPHVYFSILYLIYNSFSDKSDKKFPIFIAKNKFEEKIFKSLTNEVMVDDNLFEFLNLKRNAIFPLKNNKWLVLDKVIFIDNMFYYTINSFWFNYIKINKIANEKKYYGIIGNFFERYICDLIIESYLNQIEFQVKTLSELQVQEKQTIDLSDFHIKNH